MDLAFWHTVVAQREVIIDPKKTRSLINPLFVKSCEFYAVSLFIVRLLWLSGFEVLNCWNCQHFLKGSRVVIASIKACLVLSPHCHSVCVCFLDCSCSRKDLAFLSFTYFYEDCNKKDRIHSLVSKLGAAVKI